MKILTNYSLKKYNAFHVNVIAKYFARVESSQDVSTVLKENRFKNIQKYVLGEGSGTFFATNFDGLVVVNCIKEINIVKTDSSDTYIEVGSGEIWDDLVSWAVKNSYSGIENMSFIPGTVGAAPVQNIAAYGQGFEDVFVSLEAVDLVTGKVKVFNKAQCKLSYRDSIFKNEFKNKYFITKVTLKLKTTTYLDVSYFSRFESLQKDLGKVAKKPYSLKDVRNAVKSIRTRKFPDWKKHGNTGSYFLNPFVTVDKLKEIQKSYPDVQYYPIEKMLYPKLNSNKLNNQKYVKIAAGWLLDEIGWKGKRIGNVGTSPNQALVIVNYGEATAKEILNFADKMNKDFQKHFGITLEPEVNIV